MSRIQKLPKRARRFSRAEMVMLTLLVVVAAAVLTALLLIATYDDSGYTEVLRQRREAAGQTAVYQSQLTRAAP